MAQDIVINEIMTQNDSLSGISDPNGQYDDFIELYNTSDLEVNLSNYFLTDDPTDLQKWKFPFNTFIGGNDYLVVWADNDTFQNGLHAYFKLNATGEAVALIQGAGDVQDSYEFGTATVGSSFSRVPNGMGDFILKEPSMGTNNDLTGGALISAGAVVINELVSANDSTSGISDSNGQYDDWLELYNTTNESIDIGGYFISDNPDHLRKWKIPFGTELPANSYLPVWCDNDSEQRGLHTNFNLNALGESVFISYQDETVVESVTYPALEVNNAYARIPNGTGEFVTQASTFLVENETAIGPLLESGTIVINEFMALNQDASAFTDEFNQSDDWLEIFNTSNTAINLGGYYLSDNSINPKKWAFRLDQTIGANEYLIVWCDRDSEQGPLHTNFNLASLGEEIILSYDDGTVLDEEVFPLQTLLQTWARQPNAIGPFSTDNPTFGFSNDASSINSLPIHNFNCYPNPTSGNSTFEKSTNREVELEIIDSNGRVQLRILWSAPSIQVDLKALQAGLYMIQADGLPYGKLIKLP